MKLCFFDRTHSNVDWIDGASVMCLNFSIKSTRLLLMSMGSTSASRTALRSDWRGEETAAEALRLRGVDWRDGRPQRKRFGGGQRFRFSLFMFGLFYTLKRVAPNVPPSW